MAKCKFLLVLEQLATDTAFTCTKILVNLYLRNCTALDIGGSLTCVMILGADVSMVKT